LKPIRTRFKSGVEDSLSCPNKRQEVSNSKRNVSCFIVVKLIIYFSSGSN
jgi:hypothetical protein